MIFRYAFQPSAILGGAAGAALKAAISQGAKRGLFANEAGMGSTPHAHALADVKTPHQQGCVAMVGVFVGTFAIVTITALVMIVTLYAGQGPLSTPGASLRAEVYGLNQSNLAQTAYSSVFGERLGTAFIACDKGGETEETTEAVATVAIKVNLIIKDGSTVKYEGETSCNGTLGDAIEMFCAGEFEEEITCFDENGILKTIGELTAGDGKRWKAYYEDEGQSKAFESIKDQALAEGKTVVIVLE